MMNISQYERTARVDLLGDLHKGNIIPIKEDILEKVNSEIKAVEFNFQKVKNVDAPAMAMIVIVVQHLLRKKVTSKIMGLTEECEDVANMLGLHMIADIEGES